MLTFVAGLIIGGIIGAVGMACLMVSRRVSLKEKHRLEIYRLEAKHRPIDEDYCRELESMLRKREVKDD